MSFSDNHMFIPNPLTTAANSISEEATASGTGSSVAYVAPCNLQIEEFGLLVAVTLGNTITTATGYKLSKVNAAGTETVIETMKLSNNSDGWYAGDGNPGGGTVVKATTFAYVAGTVFYKRPTRPGLASVEAGETIVMRGATTGGSATGDVVPFVVCRVAGRGYKGTNVYNEGALTRNRPAPV